MKLGHRFIVWKYYKLDVFIIEGEIMRYTPLAFLCVVYSVIPSIIIKVIWTVSGTKWSKKWQNSRIKTPIVLLHLIVIWANIVYGSSVFRVNSCFVKTYSIRGIFFSVC